MGILLIYYGFCDRRYLQNSSGIYRELILIKHDALKPVFSCQIYFSSAAKISGAAQLQSFCLKIILNIPHIQPVPAIRPALG
jgi:hypothetical protein